MAVRLLGLLLPCAKTPRFLFNVPYGTGAFSFSGLSGDYTLSVGGPTAGQGCTYDYVTGWWNGSGTSPNMQDAVNVDGTTGAELTIEFPYVAGGTISGTGI